MKAFPTEIASPPGYRRANYDEGMDLRDYFAAKAMTGGMWVATTEGNTYDRDAQECYKIADAMMKAREKNNAKT